MGDYKKIAGEWIQVESTNVDEFLKVQGFGWPKRKIAIALTPVITFSFPDEKNFEIYFSTSVKSDRRVYILNGITKHQNYAGDDVETETFVEDNMVVLITRGQSCGDIRTERKLDGDKMIITGIIYDAKNKKEKARSTRTFKRQK